MSVAGFDSYTSVEREAAAVLGTAHGINIRLVQQTTLDEEAGDPFPAGRLQSYLRRSVVLGKIKSMQ